MLDGNAVDCLFLNPLIICRLQIRLTIRGSPRSPPGLHSGHIPVFKLSCDPNPFQHGTVSEWYQFHIVVRRAEVKHPQTGILLLICGWLDDSGGG